MFEVKLDVDEYTGYLPVIVLHAVQVVVLRLLARLETFEGKVKLYQS